MKRNALQKFTGWLKIFAPMGVLSFMFGWFVVLCLALCRFIPRTVRFDGVQNMLLCGVALTWGISLFLSPILVDAFSDNEVWHFSRHRNC